LKLLRLIIYLARWPERKENLMNDRERNVLVAGAAGGIGRAAVEMLLEKNFRVIAVDRNRLLLETLNHPSRTRLETVTLDITDREGVREIAGEFKSRGRMLRALMIPAGVHSTHPVPFLSDDLVDSVLDVNLASHIKLVRDFLPVIEDGGSILGVSSIAAGVGVPMSSLYSASKWGLEGFYESLFNELKHRDIRVSVIHPGNVNTGFNETGNTYSPRGDSEVDTRYARVVARIDSRYGIPPQRVARVMVRAMESRRPRFCYLVGGNARKAYWAKRLLGRDTALRLMGKFFGF
jgi:NAD(P)-dependent dehydrogenase (short-subunit alcohol dehydrogenase family)